MGNTKQQVNEEKLFPKKSDDRSLIPPKEKSKEVKEKGKMLLND